MSEEESENVSSSSSEEEDEDAKELTLDVEKKFLKTLQSLKTKDPIIYDANIEFFDTSKQSVKESTAQCTKGKHKEKKVKPFLLSDYDKLLVRSGGEIKEDLDVQPSYSEEQEALKSNLKKALLSDDSDDDSSLLTLKPKIKTDTAHSPIDEEAEIKHWLTGAKDELRDKTLEQELKPLHDIWTHPELDDGETYLRDYILNKRYLDEAPKKSNSESEASSGDESDFDEKQEEFEHKYNFRFEEPDQEFIKRYPRTMEASMRRKESKRKLKREQAKKNREEKLEKKKGEIKKLKNEKREEILAHLKHLKNITGNQTSAFKDDMLEGDFDPDQHDKIMEAMFNEEFYAGQDEEKPVFEDDGEDIDYPEYEDIGENGEDMAGEEFQQDFTDQNAEDCDGENYGEFTENGELITDCDYNPSAAASISSGRKLSRAKLKRLKRKEKKFGAAGPLAGAAHKSLFAQAVERPKPVFNPKDETFMKYVDEYYGLEFEDLIGDMPCRFKYKRVVPNSYGLSIEEILAADDKELNKWCPVKKLYSQRLEHVEKNEVKVYSQRAKDENLKRKLLPSLYKPPEEIDEEDEAVRILPTDAERKELMNKKQKKIQQVSEQFEKEKQNTKKNVNEDDDEMDENVFKEKEDVIDESIVNEYLKEKKRNAKAKSNKQKLEIINGLRSSKVNDSNEGITHEEGETKAAKKKKKGKAKATVGINEAENQKSVDNKKRKADNEMVETNEAPRSKKRAKGNCDKTVENGIAKGEEGKKKKRRKKKMAKRSEDQEENFDKHVVNGIVKGQEVKKKKRKKKKKKTAKKSEDEEILSRINEAVGEKEKTKVDESNRKTSEKSDSGMKSKKQHGQKGGEDDKKNNTLKKKITNKQGKKENSMKGVRTGNKFKRKNAEKVTDLSDARLKAYGINPKKFKSKLLYGNKDREKT